jgi:NhaP-type Na+/H+ or K+/H+ antiporter
LDPCTPLGRAWRETVVLSLLGLLVTTALAAFYCWWLGVQDGD